MRNLWVIDNSCIEFLVYIRQAYITRSGQTEWSIQWCQVFESWFRWGTNLLGWFPYLKKHCHGVLLNFELRARIFRVGLLLILDTYIYQTLAKKDDLKHLWHYVQLLVQDERQGVICKCIFEKFKPSSKFWNKTLQFVLCFSRSCKRQLMLLVSVLWYIVSASSHLVWFM